MCICGLCMYNPLSGLLCIVSMLLVCYVCSVFYGHSRYRFNSNKILLRLNDLIYLPFSYQRLLRLGNWCKINKTTVEFVTVIWIEIAQFYHYAKDKSVNIKKLFSYLSFSYTIINRVTSIIEVLLLISPIKQVENSQPYWFYLFMHVLHTTGNQNIPQLNKIISLLKTKLISSVLHYDDRKRNKD